MLIALYLPKEIKQSQHKYLKDLYKASAIVLTFISLVTSVSEVCLHMLNAIVVNQRYGIDNERDIAPTNDYLLI